MNPAPDVTGLAARISATAYVNGTYQTATGETLRSYLDEYALAADPVLLREVAAALTDLIPVGTEVLAGLELGGVPLVVALSAASGLPAAFLRRTPKPHGTQRQVEGHPVAARQVVLVDDVIRTGAQTTVLARVVRRQGGIVTSALCLLERPLGGRQVLARNAIGLHALFTEADLGCGALPGRSPGDAA